VPRANVYGAIENLVKKGAVQMVGQQPARFVPVPPKELMSNIAKSTSDRCERITSLIKDVETDTTQEVVWTIKGEEKVHDRISAMIDRAEEHIWIKASEDILEQHLTAMKAAHDRGVKIVIILFGTRKEMFSFGKRTRIYLHEGDGFRVGSADNLFTMTIDYAEAITARMKDDYLGAHTRSGPVVTMAETIIRHEIYLAEIFSRFNTEIVDAFGPYLLNLRRSLFSKEQVALMNARLKELGIIDGAATLPRKKTRPASTAD
jgi:hypothetical protein